jgi:NADH-quinone oxidoreductase subunit L
VINWLVGGYLKDKPYSETFSGAVACGTIAISTIVAFMISFGIGTAHVGVLLEGGPPVVLDHIWTWVNVGGFRADFALGMDRLSGIYALFVTFVGLLIHIFATGYMHGDKGFYRFFAYLNLFMFSMLTLVLADNFLLMFVGWEGVGLCSYLLIGYYIKRDEAREAAKKAFVMNRIGDWGVLMGIFLVFTMTGSISFYDKAVDGAQVTSALTTIAGMGTDAFGLGTIFAGGITSDRRPALYRCDRKISADPLVHVAARRDGRPDTCVCTYPRGDDGHRPVSTWSFAATGSIRMHRQRCSLSRSSELRPAIFAATIGLAQNDIKKVLAYSTVSQLGYMFLACGVGAFIAAIFHVMTHAFFKALLFLGSGSVIHGNASRAGHAKMGNLRKYMPITFFTMMMGWLAICGIPIWAGFFSKDEILYKTFATHNHSRSSGITFSGESAHHRRADRGLHDADDVDDVLR